MCVDGPIPHFIATYLLLIYIEAGISESTNKPHKTEHKLGKEVRKDTNVQSVLEFLLQIILQLHTFLASSECNN